MNRSHTIFGIRKSFLPNFFTLIFCIQCISISAQETSIKWFNPEDQAMHVIEGQAWPDEVESAYDRLPSRAEGKVANDVWNLSNQSAGLMIRFRSNATEIKVRYSTKKKNYGMDHMPATGVSGVDLYAIDSDGKELWCAGKRNFSDTISYIFPHLNPNDGYHEMGREYRLYFPLYNVVEWLEIGVDGNTYFEFLPSRKEKPIVVYGTSITQGACASRPGMAWAAILSRKMDRQLINLGFSGAGRLEPPLIDLMSEIDAKIYILDCLPNLSAPAWKRLGIDDPIVLKNRVLNAVRTLKLKQPDIPILLVDHAGYTEEFVSEKRKLDYSVANVVQKEAFAQLKEEGIDRLYYLTKEEIGLQLDDMVDGVHPTDRGMTHYAESYEKKLRFILNEPIGDVSTTQPCIQSREPNNYDWQGRHGELLNLKYTDYKTAIFANSIVHFWGGLPKAKLAVERESWETVFTPYGVRNYAFGWDRIENVLWRIYHGEIDGINLEKIVVMIGTNNLHLNTNSEIIEGLQFLIQAIKFRQEKAEIILMGILPRREYEERIEKLNFQFSQLAGEMNVNYADIGSYFLNENGKIHDHLFRDGLHPNVAGYLKLRDALTPFLIK